MYTHHITAKMLDPRWKGRIVTINKMELTTPERTKKEQFSRLQLPLRLAYCITINKVQNMKGSIRKCIFSRKVKR